MLAAFLELTKPRLNFLVVLTAMAGFGLGLETGSFPWRLFFNVLGSISVLAGSSAALNMWAEKDTDALMKRTEKRPLPAGRLEPFQALVFGLSLATLSLIWMAYAVNLITCFVGVLTLMTYIVWYTPFKKTTVLSTWIGAVPGALPPVMGWTSVTGRLDEGALALFAILFFWQIPHFLAIAAMYREDYAAANLQVTPNLVEGNAVTGRQMLFNSVALVCASMFPTLLKLSGTIYFAGALVLGAFFTWTAVKAAWGLERPMARRMLLVSVFYLPLLFTLMLVDKI